MGILKKVHSWRKKKKKKEVNQLLEEEGFTDEVLEKQAKINQLRHKHGIVDESKIIHDKYVQ